MPIRLILENNHSFTSEDAHVLIDAFENTLRELNLVDREDPLTLLVAKRIIEIANEGERDPIKLRERALKSFKS
jgi:hypothetical protein